MVAQFSIGILAHFSISIYTIKWLTDELGKKTAIMSKWYTNVLYTFDKIARLFDIDIQEHITGTNWIYDR